MWWVSGGVGTRDRPPDECLQEVVFPPAGLLRALTIPTYTETGLKDWHPQQHTFPFGAPGVFKAP